MRKIKIAALILVLGLTDAAAGRAFFPPDPTDVELESLRRYQEGSSILKNLNLNPRLTASYASERRHVLLVCAADVTGTQTSARSEFLWGVSQRPIVPSEEGQSMPFPDMGVAWHVDERPVWLRDSRRNTPRDLQMKERRQALRHA